MQRKTKPKFYPKFNTYVAVAKLAVHAELPPEKMMEIARIAFKPKTKLAEDRLWNKMSRIYDVLKTSADIDTEMEVAQKLQIKTECGFPQSFLQQIINGTYPPPKPKSRQRKKPRNRTAAIGH